MMLLVTSALAGWQLEVMHGTVPPDTLAASQRLVEGCPAEQQDWVARFGDGQLQRFGAVAGGDGGAGAAASCIEAGLEAQPLPGTTVVRVAWSNPQSVAYEQRVLGVLDQAVGPRELTPCTTLRFVIAADGSLGPPSLALSSGSEEADAKVLEAVGAWPAPLPPVPDSLRGSYDQDIELCVGGIQGR